MRFHKGVVIISVKITSLVLMQQVDSHVVLNVSVLAIRCKVFINPPVVVRPGGVNHNAFIVVVRPGGGANHNDKCIMISPPLL